MNHNIHVGRLTKDPELKQTPNGTSVCKFSMALNHVYYKNEQKVEEVTFCNYESWGKQAEAISKYVKKGDQFCVHSRVKQDSWTDEKTGDKRSVLKFIVSDFDFCGGRTQHESAPSEPAQEPARSESFNDDDIPF